MKVVFAELVASLHEQGKSANQYLQELYKRYLSLEIAYCRPYADAVTALATDSSR